MSAPVCYQLSFTRAAHHLIDVTATFEVGDVDTVVLRMPAWSPGSYMIRDYAKHVEGARACADDGQALSLKKTSKDSFEIQTQGEKRITVHYAVYGREMTVRTNFVCEDFALVQGSATLLGYAPLFGQAHRVEVQLPAEWRDASCGLVRDKEAPHAFVAPSYDALVDSPLLLGTQRIETFEVEGVEHVLATLGGDETFDPAEAAADARAIVRQNVKLWRSIPYERYVFLNVLFGGGGGLEHHHSSVLMGTANARATAKQREDYAGLIAHEHFHVWNIKRLRPVALGPFDYQHENYTPSLWVAEGLTAYYDDLQVCRAGLVSPAAYLARLAKSIEQLQQTPGRLASSLRLSSMDAWIKLYKPDENTINSTVSYYLKGSLVGWLLDAQIRHVTHNERSLDDVMRLAMQRHSGAIGFTEAEFRGCIGEVAGYDARLLRWLNDAIDGTDEQDWSPALSHYGLQLHWQCHLDGRPKHRDVNGVLGVHLESTNPNAVIAQVLQQSPAYRAGLNVGDEIVAVRDARVKAEDLLERLTGLAERGATNVSLLLSRRGSLVRRTCGIDKPHSQQAKLTFVPSPTAAQQAAREAWLGPVAAPTPSPSS